MFQKSTDKNKIDWLDEPQVYCATKGRKHKRYELGGKVPEAIFKAREMIVSTVAHPKNILDTNTHYRRGWN